LKCYDRRQNFVGYATFPRLKDRGPIEVPLGDNIADSIDRFPRLKDRGPIEVIVLLFQLAAAP